jgi:repressor LexA|tara:strand:- start:651 stop:866 length:216 start_codon:yes stop_codon:yes gene_type:complete
MKKITEPQQKVFEFIKAEIRRNQRPPTVSEIANQFHWKSPNAAWCVLCALQKKGYIKLANDNKARGIRVIR